MVSGAMACRPSGDLMKANQKNDFIRELKSTAGAAKCVKELEANVVKNKKTWSDVSIFETIRMGATTYDIRSSQRLVVTVSLVSGGKQVYSCGKATPLPKCM